MAELASLEEKKKENIKEMRKREELRGTWISHDVYYLIKKSSEGKELEEGEQQSFPLT